VRTGANNLAHEEDRQLVGVPARQLRVAEIGSAVVAQRSVARALTTSGWHETQHYVGGGSARGEHPDAGRKTRARRFERNGD